MSEREQFATHCEDKLFADAERIAGALMQLGYFPPYMTAEETAWMLRSLVKRCAPSETAPSTKAWSEMNGFERAAYNAGVEAAPRTLSAIPSAMVGPRITFMYDNHTFRAIDVLDRAKASQQIMACFAEDGSGGAFIQWGSADGERPRDTSRPKNYVLHGHMMGEGKRWGVTDWELEAFLDHFYAIEPREVDRRKK